MPSLNQYINTSTWAVQTQEVPMVKKRFARTKAVPIDPTKPVLAKEGFTFGSDPEGFIFKGDKPVPASDFIPGTKHEPHPVDGGAIQVDGMAAEYNTNPAATYEEWEENHVKVQAALRELLPKDHELRFVPSVCFDADTFNAAPDRHKELGCQPDFDAWSGGVNPPPEPENPYVRCSGGHIHTGWTKNEDLCDLQHILNCQDLVKQYDWFLGGWSVQHDPDTVRRTLYGKMGACRYKDYGVEYRVLSSFWVNTPEMRLEVWNRMNHAVHQVAKLFLPDRVPRALNDSLRNLINSAAESKDLKSLCIYPLQTLDVNNNRW